MADSASVRWRADGPVSLVDFLSVFKGKKGMVMVAEAERSRSHGVAAFSVTKLATVPVKGGARQKHHMWPPFANRAMATALNGRAHLILSAKHSRLARVWLSVGQSPLPKTTPTRRLVRRSFQSFRRRGEVGRAIYRLSFVIRRCAPSR